MLRDAARRASVTRVHLFVIRDVNACNFAPVITGVVGATGGGEQVTRGCPEIILRVRRRLNAARL